MRVYEKSPECRLKRLHACVRPAQPEPTAGVASVCVTVLSCCATSLTSEQSWLPGEHQRSECTLTHIHTKNIWPGPTPPQGMTSLLKGGSWSVDQYRAAVDTASPWLHSNWDYSTWPLIGWSWLHLINIKPINTEHTKGRGGGMEGVVARRSEEHTSELQSR